jgi:hypothetical protein
MKVPGKRLGPPLIISQKFTVHGHVLEGRESRDEVRLDHRVRDRGDRSRRHDQFHSLHQLGM